jgi:hypothetical protein
MEGHGHDGGDNVEVEAFLTGYVQVDHEVHLEGEVRERWTRCWRGATPWKKVEPTVTL